MLDWDRDGNRKTGNMGGTGAQARNENGRAVARPFPRKESAVYGSLSSPGRISLQRTYAV